MSEPQFDSAVDGQYHELIGARNGVRWGSCSYANGATMNKICKIFMVILALLSSPILAGGKSMISKTELEEMFQNISENTNWDLKKPLLWGYFFTDKSKDKLKASGSLLEQQGYRLVNIYQAKDDSGNLLDYWWLHVEKVEVHTADSLYQRNMNLYQLANQQGLSSYDGMDVGPASQ